jgi:1-deoxy-D-xylulose-5-phosphate reductoisomerase
MGKRVAILGSTGSIGQNALRVIAALGPEYQVAALTAHSRTNLLVTQVKQFKPAVVAVTHPDFESECKSSLNGFPGKILCGPEGLVEIVTRDDVDIVLCAIVGAAGLPAVLAAARAGKRLAIANKEPLVIAGELLTREAAASGALILPIDSEHSAVFQALQAGRRQEVRRIVLTASGGPFLRTSRAAMEEATVQQALAHPTWRMGPKITVDSATMMNKALEVIEARWLFGLPVEQINVLIHPESVVHSMVEFIDGSIIAQMGTPDMKTPIQYALTYPDRKAGIAEGLKLEEMGRLTFEPPDPERFRALTLGYEAARTGGSAPVVFNAANEAAVAAFLENRIRFGRIIELIEQALEAHQVQEHLSLEALLETDRWARQHVQRRLECMNPV